jgi:trehalose 6-phosphate phosphatase
MDPLTAVLDAMRAAPASALVALDFDGTLAPIVADPARAVPLPGAVEALVALAARVGQVAVITGRQAEVAVRLGGLERVPGLRVLGLYGAEHWRDGELRAAQPPAGLAAARTAVRALVEAAGSGAVLEDKGASLAVHTRRAPEPVAALAGLRPALEALAAEHGLQVEPGRLVLELRAPGLDKGTSLRDLARDVAARSVLFAGDDLGDLPAFAAVRALRSAGVPAVGVAVRSAESPEALLAADVVVEDQEELVQLLGRLAR